MHARLAPRAHRFTYRIFLFALDLDELPALHSRLRLFSRERPNLYAFRDRDFLPVDAATSSAPTLKQRVAAFAERHGLPAAPTRVVLVTLPRVAGYLFNPVSFYFCFDGTGAPVGAIAEVTNTFREVKPYWLGPDDFSHADDTFHLRVPKHFYVSPFSDVDVAFDFTFHLPGGRLAVQIDDYVGRHRTLVSRLTGTRHPLTDTRLAWFTLKYPLLSLRVIALIHWHALRLWLKRVPWFAKAARPELQRDLLRPHAPLQPSTSHALLPRNH